MVHFTHDEWSPSEKTIKLIKQIAYSCRSFRLDGQSHLYCLN